MKQKAFFIIFKGLSVAKNYLRPASAPLNIASLHSARQEFITCESSGKIIRPLWNNIPSSGEYYTSNKEVYFKREKSEKWKGLVTVLQRDGPVLFLHHGPKFVKAHKYRVQPVEAKGQTESVNPSIQPTAEPIPPCNSSPNYTPNNSVRQNDEDSDDNPEA